METFLVLNGYELRAGVDEQEALVLGVAAGTIGRQGFTTWVADHVVKRG
jgi:death-on-curing protein